MEDNKNTILPLGLKIFFSIMIIINTLPMMLVSIMKLLNMEISDRFAFIVSVISKSAGLILSRDNLPVLFSLVLGLLILFVFYKLIIGGFNLTFFQKRIWLNLWRVGKIFAILSAIMVLYKASKNPKYIIEWNFVANSILLLVYNSVFLYYLYSKEAKNFFLVEKKELKEEALQN